MTRWSRPRTTRPSRCLRRRPASDDSSKKVDEAAPSEAKPTPAAVVPAAFPVPVETGSVLDKPTEKIEIVGTPSETKPEATKPTEIKAPEAVPAAATPPDQAPTPTSAPGTPSPDTTRVHLGDTTPGTSTSAARAGQAVARCARKTGIRPRQRRAHPRPRPVGDAADDLHRSWRTRRPDAAPLADRRRSRSRSS